MGGRKSKPGIGARDWGIDVEVQRRRAMLENVVICVGSTPPTQDAIVANESWQVGIPPNV